jgi:hypothetical protein
MNVKAKAQADFFKGHLGVMILLLTSSPENRDKIFDILSGDSPQEKVDALIEVVQDFVGLHQEVTKRMTFMLEETLPEEPEEDAEDVPGQLGGDDPEERPKGQTMAPINRAALANTLYSDDRDHEAVERLIRQLEEWRNGLNS